MNRFVMITAAGPDRPGIVAGLAKVLYETGCNIEDTSMTLLRGEFAMMLIVRLPRRMNLAQLERRFGPVRKNLGLALMIKPLSAKEARRGQPSAGRPYILSVYGSDKPGIVYRVSQLLAVLSINITDMNTRVIGSKDRPIYVMVMEVEIPQKVKIRTLEARLQKLKKAVNVDITLHPVESAEF